ncbi:MAG: phytanoyl-CoA dioxygenase family protein [Candidatus Competibacteraceae bacterium]|nr:phytanoyl-CoA dioxygenase family protein [Candidatus Competibacteraceae bacterium]
MSNRVTESVTQHEIDTFQRDGAIKLSAVFDPHWLEQLAHGIEKNFQQPGPNAKRYTPEDGPGGFYGDYCNWQRIGEYQDFVFNSPAAALLAGLLQTTTLRFYHEHVLVKEPGTREVTPWHHDLPYYGLEGQQVCSIWLPLDPVPLSACPEFVAGSHRWGKRFMPRMFVDHRNYADVPAGYEQVPDIDAERDQHRILAWDLQPGDCIVFHMLTLHGAPATAELNTRRRGFATRWLGDDAVYAARPWPTSPPFDGIEVKPGQPVRHPDFPVVWGSGLKPVEG